MVLAACGGSTENSTTTPDGSDATSAPPMETAVDAAETTAILEDVEHPLTVDIDEATELGRVEISGAAAGAVGTVVITADNGTDEVSVESIVITDADGTFFTAPLHPLSPGEGGEVSAVVDIDGQRSANTIIDLAPIPDDPGGFDRAVAALTADLSATIEAAGMTVDEVRSTEASQLPPAIVPLAWALDLVDDGTNADLGSYFDDAWATPDEQRVADAVAGALLRDRSAGPVSFRALPSDRGVATAMLGWQPHRAPAQLACTDGGPASIGSGEELATLLNIGADAQIMKGGAEEKVLADIATLTGNGKSAADYAAGKAAGEAIATFNAVGKAIEAVGTVFSVAAVGKRFVGGVMPSDIRSITAEADVVDFDEDFTESGRITKTLITATSTGFKLDVNPTEMLFDHLSGELQKRAGSAAGELTAGLSDLERDFAGTAVDATLAETAKRGKAKMFDDAVLTALNFCPQVWEVPVVEAPYVLVESVTGRFDVDEGSLTFQPNDDHVDTPSDTLKISANPESFRGRTASTQLPVNTKPITLSLSPDEIEINKAGDEVVLTSSVNNAENDRIRWTTSGGRFVDGLPNETDGNISRTLKTPDNEGAFEIIVTIESISETGLRDDRQPSRIATAVIDLAELIISPDPAKVTKQRSIQLTATRPNGDPVEVHWNATGGQIDANGLYTAGDRLGTFEVTAVATSDPNLTADGVIEIVEGECAEGQWRVRAAEFWQQFPGATKVELGGGEWVVTFAADRSFTDDRRNLTLDMGDGITLTLDGVGSGEWSSNDDQSQITVVSSGSTVSASFSINGAPMVLDQSVPVEAFGDTVPYECDGDLMTMTSDGYDLVLDRVG